jgi:hypothetical protein
MKELQIKTPYGIKNWSYIKKLMDEDSNNSEEEPDENDLEEICRWIKDGNTSGLLNNGEGFRVYWQIKINKWKD